MCYGTDTCMYWIFVIHEHKTARSAGHNLSVSKLYTCLKTFKWLRVRMLSHSWYGFARCTSERLHVVHTYIQSFVYARLRVCAYTAGRLYVRFARLVITQIRLWNYGFRVIDPYIWWMNQLNLSNQLFPTNRLNQLNQLNSLNPLNQRHNNCRTINENQWKYLGNQ